MITYHCDNPGCEKSIEGHRATRIMLARVPAGGEWRSRFIGAKPQHEPEQHHACSADCASIIDEAEADTELDALRSRWTVQPEA